jgi:hypothetical protein
MGDEYLTLYNILVLFISIDDDQRYQKVQRHQKENKTRRAKRVQRGNKSIDVGWQWCGKWL